MNKSVDSSEAKPLKVPIVRVLLRRAPIYILAHTPIGHILKEAVKEILKCLIL